LVDAFVYRFVAATCLLHIFKILKDLPFNEDSQLTGDITSPKYSAKQNKLCCHEVLEEDSEFALLDYEVTEEGKYRCRDCGQLFETLEAHDRHHRTSHMRAESIPVQGMTM
jgi:hypothetical protein